MKVAIIPARGGSKRIPRKNIKLFEGLPMIARSIIAAQDSGCFDKIIVSTDDEEIAKIATEWGAEVPFMRPAELADDYAGTIPVIRHAVEWVEVHISKVDYACCIYATAPFISALDLKEGEYLLTTHVDRDYAFSVTSYAFPIQRAVRIDSEQRITMFSPEHFTTRSQDLDEAWHDAGQFYWGTGQAWLEERPLFANRSLPVKLPRHRVQDIDTEEDWVRAEWLFKAMKAQEGSM